MTTAIKSYYKKKFPKLITCLHCQTEFTAETIANRFCSDNCKVTHFKEYQRNWKRALRKTVIDAYGGICVCCNESVFEFLTIDHINGNGRKHRRSIRPQHYDRGSILYQWLKNNNFPEGFQVLCYNCNCSKGFYGECPHEKKTQTIN